MGTLLKPLQLTLAIIKPHVVSNPIALEDIRRIIVANHFKVILSDKRKLSVQDAEGFYAEHKEKFFYNRLVTFMSSSAIELYVLAQENAISDWRKLIGPTKVYKTQFTDPDSIRGKYGLSDTRNAVHGSDSVESATNEIKFFFPKFNIENWYQSHEPLFRNGNVEFNEDRFLHSVM